MAELAQVLRHVTPVDDPNALLDASTGDDAAVYRIDENRALVVTLDFFTPIVDDPTDFGRIAAANALSDIYAMGARPLFALNVVAFPRELLTTGLLEAIVAGASGVCRDAGVPVLGGHSIDDPEPKFGLVAVGEVDPARMITNAGARPGDRLVLTKPIGSGVVATALKADAASEETVRSAVEAMTRLNREASRAALDAGVRAGTDVSGFGLLGHLRSMLRASGAAATLWADAVPLLPGALELAAAGHIAGGTRRNAEDVATDVVFAEDVDEALRLLLADAQTSGGLLLAVRPDRVADVLGGLRAESTAVVGEVRDGPAGTIRVEA